MKPVQYSWFFGSEGACPEDPARYPSRYERDLPWNSSRVSARTGDYDGLVIVKQQELRSVDNFDVEKLWRCSHVEGHAHALPVVEHVQILLGSSTSVYLQASWPKDEKERRMFPQERLVELAGDIDPSSG